MTHSRATLATGRGDPLSGVRARLGLLRLELRRSPALLFFPALVLISWWTARQTLPVRVSLWPETSVAIGDGVQLLAPLMGALAAWIAGRDRRRGIEELLATTPRPPAGRDLTVWASTALWSAAAYMTVAAILMGSAYVGATWGGPLWPPILVGLITMLAASTLGYAAGSYIPGRLTAPLLGLALFIIQMAPTYYTSSVAHLSPLAYPFRADVWRGLYPDITASQMLWLAGLVGLGLAAIRLRHSRGALSWALLLGACAVSAAGATALLNTRYYDDPSQAPAIPYEAVCRDAAVPVCMHPAYKAMLPETAALLDRVLEPLAGVPGAPRRAEQGQILEFTDDGVLRMNLGNAARFDYGYEMDMSGIVSLLVSDPEAEPEMISREGMGEVCGTAECEAYWSEGGGQQAQRVLYAWLMKQLRLELVEIESPYGSMGFGAPPSLGSAAADAALKRFSALTPDQRRQWLMEHYADLRVGKVAVEELP